MAPRQDERKERELDLLCDFADEVRMGAFKGATGKRIRNLPLKDQLSKA